MVAGVMHFCLSGPWWGVGARGPGGRVAVLGLAASRGDGGRLTRGGGVGKPRGFMG